MLAKYFEYVKKMDYYNQAYSLIEWDQTTKAPKESMDNKLELMSFLYSKLHEMRTADEYEEILLGLKELSENEKMNLIDANYPNDKNPEELLAALNLTIKRELESFEERRRIPTQKEAEYVEMLGKSNLAWRSAKENNRFEEFAPWLEKNIELTKERMTLMHPDMKVYDALLGREMEGITSEDVNRIFDEIKRGISPIVDRVKGKKPGNYACDKLTSSPETMSKVQDYILAYMGFDLNNGTTGESAHPMTSVIDNRDVRITNNFKERNPIEVCISSIHEGGHGIYFQKVDPRFLHLAPHDLKFSDVHEAQSRFYENMLGRNRAFWDSIYDDLCGIWPELKTVSTEDISSYLNRCECGELRTSADELTYCLHIILRYEIEIMLFNDEIKVKDLPEIWNSKMREMLGVVPRDNAHGVLQDIHWSSVFWGYFPDYLIGSVYDGIYLEALEKELGSVDTLLLNKKIPEINDWLYRNIHRPGSLYNGPELIKRISGGDVTADALVRYFNKKYKDC